MGTIQIQVPTSIESPIGAKAAYYLLVQQQYSLHLVLDLLTWISHWYRSFTDLCHSSCSIAGPPGPGSPIGPGPGSIGASPMWCHPVAGSMAGPPGPGFPLVLVIGASPGCGGFHCWIRPVVLDTLILMDLHRACLVWCI